MAELEIGIEGGIATLTLNRPEVRNALGNEMRAMLREWLPRLEQDPAVRCVVLRGAGGNFMAGGDLANMSSILDGDPAGLHSHFLERVNSMNSFLFAMRRMPKPVVASVAGAAAGAGVSIALAADLVIAAEDAFFLLSHSRVGTTPDGGATFQLPRTIGIKKAMEMTLLANRLGAQQAADLGMVNFVVPPDQLEQETAALAGRLARGPTAVYGRAKALLYRSIETPFEVQVQAEAESFAACATERDFREGVDAFLEKRKPEFRGR